MFTITNLTCEYATNPLGLDARRPRFAWQLTHPQRGQRQSAYQLLVASSPDKLAAAQPDLWDSGKVDSPASIQIDYNGKPLVSRQQCWWKVRSWDAQSRMAESQPATFEMGLLEQSDWIGHWIGYPAGWVGRALYFRHQFKLETEVVRARIYVAGIGYHELRLNGQKVGDNVLDPGQTAYDKRVLYVTHDITSQLRQGDNTLALIVGHGWYGMPKLMLQAHIDFADGTTRTIATGHGAQGSFQVGCGPIIANSIFDGETFDARQEDLGWDTPGFDAGGPVFNAGGPGSTRAMRWTMASVVESPGGQLVSQTCEPIKVVETRKPQSVRQAKPGVWVFDNGQNLAGWARLRLRDAAPGQQITLRFAESVYPDGTVNQENLYIARAADIYIARGGQSVEEYEPRFTYHGFRYVQVEGLTTEPAPDTLDIRVVRSAVDRRGQFSCSNPLLDRIHEAVMWTEASNIHSVPTDCPQRAERMGWLNDLTARSEQAVFNFNLARLYGKFAQDIADTQAPDGAVPDTVPFRWGHHTADPVCIAFLLLPWHIYRHYGDTRILRQFFGGMKAWVLHLRSLADGEILKYTHWGDWSEPSGDETVMRSPVSQRTPGELVSTAFLAFHASLLSKIAGAIGERDDQQNFDKLARRIAEAFNRAFWDESAGGYGKNSQAANALAIALGLVPADRIARVVANLARDVMENNRGHLTTGNIATKYVPEVLSAHGHHDIAYTIASQTSYPSWGYMLGHGATTIWERWEYSTGGAMNSHNHPMLGSIGAWFYKYAAGLDVAPDAAGSDRFTLTPRPVADLTHAQAALDTIRGRAVLEWRRDGNHLSIHAEVPTNATATLRLPSTVKSVTEAKSPVWPTAASLPEGITNPRQDTNNVLIELGGGRYAFECTM